MPSLNDFHNLFAIDMSWVDFGYSKFDGDGKPEFWSCLRVISKCQSLQAINLHKTGVTDRDLQELAGMPNLKCLDLSKNREVTDDGLVHLASIKPLQMLGLEGTCVTKTGVEKLRAALPNCEIEWDETP